MDEKDIKFSTNKESLEEVKEIRMRLEDPQVKIYKSMNKDIDLEAQYFSTFCLPKKVNTFKSVKKKK